MGFRAASLSETTLPVWCVSFRPQTLFHLDLSLNLFYSTSTLLFLPLLDNLPC